MIVPACGELSEWHPTHSLWERGSVRVANQEPDLAGFMSIVRCQIPRRILRQSRVRFDKEQFTDTDLRVRSSWSVQVRSGSCRMLMLPNVQSQLIKER